MSVINLQLWRWDRDPQMHYYGDPIDALLDDLAGGANRLDRTTMPPQFPSASVEGTGIRFELHEDGPSFQFVVDQIPDFITAAAALVTLWRTRRPRNQAPSYAQHTVKIQVGEHKYEGDPSPEELARLLPFFNSLVTEHGQAGARPQEVD